MARYTALVAGARGIVGRAFLEEFETDPRWDLIGVGRGPKDFPTRARFVQVDLLDRAQCEARLRELTAVTHVFFTAVTRPRTAAEKAAEALAMIRNLVEPLEAAAPGLAHVQLMQGTNWYGSHLGPFKTPAKESDPRCMPPLFYYPQHDWLVERQQGKRWTWSALRPTGVFGFSTANPVSHLMGLALYGAISKELGLPYRWPGAQAHFDCLYQFTDARLLARAMAWAGTEPKAANRAFNLTNGDLQRWRHLWPALAEFFGLAPGPIQTVRLAEMMADKEPLWARMVAKYGLQPYTLADLVDWTFNDRIYRAGYDQISSMVQAREAGWHEVMDSQTMLLDQLGALRRDRIIP